MCLDRVCRVSSTWGKCYHLHAKPLTIPVPFKHNIHRVNTGKAQYSLCNLKFGLSISFLLSLFHPLNTLHAEQSSISWINVWLTQFCQFSLKNLFDFESNRCCLSALLMLSTSGSCCWKLILWHPPIHFFFYNPSPQCRENAANLNDVCQRFEVYCSKRLQLTNVLMHCVKLIHWFKI